MKPDLPARALFRGIDDASVEGARIHVQTHGTLIELARVDDSVHRVIRIDGARFANIHLHGVLGLELADSRLEILTYEMEVLHLQTAHGHRHPAILIAMVVHRTRLPNFPADRHQLKQWRALDEVSRVMLAIPAEIRQIGRA